MLHIILALAVLFSTTGITVNRHFCGHKPVNTAVFLRANTCGNCCHDAANDQSVCTLHQQATDDNCCHDESKYFKPDHQKALAGLKYKALEQPVLAGVLSWPALTIPVFHNNIKLLAYLHHRPPLIRGNLQVWLQVFRF